MEVTGAAFLLCFFLAVTAGQETPAYWPWTQHITKTEEVSQGFCRWYNCGEDFGSCSCASSCQYYGNCCEGYSYYCSHITQEDVTTEEPPTASTSWSWETTQPSCRYNCGSNLGSCSCSSSCQYYGTCCNDFYRYCPSYSTNSPDTTAQPSCRYNCGSNLGSCSCSSSCQYYGTCCNDFYWYCPSYSTNSPDTTAQPSCRYNCGSNLGSCSCSSSCQYYGTCCNDFYRYCPSYSTNSPDTTAQPSCRYNCGSNLGSCSCSSSCQYYGTCCNDFYWYCPSYSTNSPDTTDQPHCRNNCGYNLGNCSCSSSCQYYGTCCNDFYRYCQSYSTYSPDTTASHPPCGGSLNGSGVFTSPNYPHYYYDNTFCVWQLSAPPGQRIFLSFTEVALENCCVCDYISVHDGPSLNSSRIGNVCNNDGNHTKDTFHSSSNYMTVLFRTDTSIVSNGFQALFSSSLTEDQGRVDCSSDNLNIVIQKSYLDSMGYSGHDLYLDDQYCRPSIGNHQVIFSYPLNTCGTIREFKNGRVTYTNNVRADRTLSGVITRQSFFRLHVGCRMEEDTMVQIFYVANEAFFSNITGMGRYNGAMTFYTSGSFLEPVYDTPYEIDLNQNLFVQVGLRRPDRSLHLFLDTCVASPNPHDFITRSYDLLRNGCKRDSTYISYSSGHYSYARFGFKAFKFLRSHEFVYLQCKVVICPVNDYNSRCRQGCRVRKARDLDSAHDDTMVTLGPIKLKGLKTLEEQKLAEDVKQEEA